ncbi:hypothetical protein SETIT_9G523700v2 [Setaria italica]|uniref:Uncharacterized protein n=1 Tax=Setaria italica TaxID=4555 RepID=A0A368SV85_SETIT|nr:hypothetical protein SETIT_9G523700v2 [Setaria italica]
MDMLVAAQGWLPVSSPVGLGGVEEDPEEGEMQNESNLQPLNT